MRIPLFVYEGIEFTTVEQIEEHDQALWDAYWVEVQVWSDRGLEPWLNKDRRINMLEYRLMTIDDYEAAYDLWIKCGNGLNNKDDSREGIEKYLKRNPSTSYVAVLNGNVVGVVLCGHDGRRGIIQHACVSPDCRRMGIGKKLVDLALDALKEEGINKVLLVAFKKNEGGNAFWESQGFTLREDLNYRNKALAEMIRIDPDYLK